MGKGKEKSKKKKEKEGDVRRRIRRRHSPQEFDKYSYYHRSVQSADTDVVFFQKVFRELKGKDPRVFREDFCGTFQLCCEWVKLNSKHQSIGVDLDPEPLEYGRTHHLAALKAEQQKRVSLFEKNVLDPELPFSDICVAMNFSHFIFKTRQEMKAYFAGVKKALNKGGIFILDIFGGSQCFDAIEDATDHGDFTYYWDQTGYDPVSGHALFHIHFKPKGKKKIERVFTYDWRLWHIPELRDILAEVGFTKTHLYWEGTTKDGEGDGNFSRTEKGEACDSWIAYIAAEAD